MTIAGVHLTWTMAAAAAAAAQWAIVALASLIAPVRMRMAFGVSTVVFAGVWLFVFDAGSRSSKANVAEASMIGMKHTGSCASVRNGMTAEDVRRRLGQPDETRNDDIVRGPGSTTLVYRDLRCAVHVFDDKVDFVD